jgi:hypothetical protein
MVSSGMLRHVALVRTNVTEEPSAPFIRVTRIGELGTILATDACCEEIPSSKLFTLQFSAHHTLCFDRYGLKLLMETAF